MEPQMLTCLSCVNGSGATPAVLPRIDLMPSWSPFDPHHVSGTRRQPRGEPSIPRPQVARTAGSAGVVTGVMKSLLCSLGGHRFLGVGRCSVHDQGRLTSPPAPPATRRLPVLR